MTEEYQVKFNYQKPDGFWRHSCTETVLVEFGTIEKKNHHKAENVIMDKYPNCKIISVRYV